MRFFYGNDFYLGGTTKVAFSFSDFIKALLKMVKVLNFVFCDETTLCRKLSVQAWQLIQNDKFHYFYKNSFDSDIFI